MSTRDDGQKYKLKRYMVPLRQLKKFGDRGEMPSQSDSVQTRAESEPQSGCTQNVENTKYATPPRQTGIRKRNVRDAALAPKRPVRILRSVESRSAMTFWNQRLDMILRDGESKSQVKDRGHSQTVASRASKSCVDVPKSKPSKMMKKDQNRN